IEDQFEPGRLQQRQIGRLDAIEDLPGQAPKLAPECSSAGTVTDQSADLGELAPTVYRRHLKTCGQCYQLLTPAVKQRIADDDNPADIPFNQRGKHGLQVFLYADHDGFQLDAYGLSPLLCFSDLERYRFIIGIHQESYWTG